MANDSEQRQTPQLSRRPVMIGLVGLAVVEAISGGITWKVLSQGLDKIYHAFVPPVPTVPIIASSFTDTFGTNKNGWLEGTDITGHLTTTLENQRYILEIDNIAATFFPYPGAVGTLPNSFTLTTTIMQEQGSPQHYYGLVFYLQLQLDAIQCYAFMINSAGSYLILRYDGGSTQQQTLGSGSSSAIQTSLYKQNQLQVIAQNGHFSFKINDQSVSLKPGQATLTDTTYTSGRLGLIITGPSASFTVSKVQLKIA